MREREREREAGEKDKDKEVNRDVWTAWDALRLWFCDY